MLPSYYFLILGKTKSDYHKSPISKHKQSFTDDNNHPFISTQMTIDKI